MNNGIFLPPILPRAELYDFLAFISDSKLPKNILDCGAGSEIPPLVIFAAYGYKTYGIDKSEVEVQKALSYSQNNNLNLEIKTGNIINLPFSNDSFSFVYSVNTLSHLSKKEIKIAIKEMERVLVPKGFLYVDVLSVEDGEYGKGQKVNQNGDTGQFLQEEDGEMVLHSYFEPEELNFYFQNTEILSKDYLKTTSYFDKDPYTGSKIGYICQKK